MDADLQQRLHALRTVMWDLAMDYDVAWSRLDPDEAEALVAFLEGAAAQTRGKLDSVGNSM